MLKTSNFRHFFPKNILQTFFRTFSSRSHIFRVFFSAPFFLSLFRRNLKVVLKLDLGASPFDLFPFISFTLLSLCFVLFCFAAVVHLEGRYCSAFLLLSLGCRIKYSSIENARKFSQCTKSTLNLYTHRHTNK